LSFLPAEVSGGDDDGLVLAAVVDAYLVGGTLLTDDDAGVAVEAGVEAAIGDAGVRLEVDGLALVEVLDGLLGCRSLGGRFSACFVFPEAVR
jgi:uncharacterized protein (UPF0212 family)